MVSSLTGTAQSAWFPRWASCRRAAAGDDHDQVAQSRRHHLCRSQYVAEELLRGEGFTDVRYVVPAPGVGFEQVPLPPAT